MALRQRLEKKCMGGQAKATPSRKYHAGSVGISTHTTRTGKHPYECSTGIPTHAMPTSKYPHAVNMNVPIHTMPITKLPYTCNTNVPIQTSLKSKQPTALHTAPSTTSRISQPPLDVAMPPLPGLSQLRPHVSLDFDFHRQKVVPKKNQIAALRRHLSPHLQWNTYEHSAVADVIEVPLELFQLQDLKGILSLEAWKGCLSPSERKFLRGLLPEGVDHGSLVRTITRGDNFYFGNPLADWGKMLLKGELHPDFVQQKELELNEANMDHYQEVQNYHDKMLQTLRRLKEEWILCKSTEKRLSPKTKRKKIRVPVSIAGNNCATEGATSWQKSKRQKVGSLQQASRRSDLPLAKDSLSIKSKLDNCVHYDGCTQCMHILKVTRKQYADIIHLLKGKGDELSVAALSPMLNYQQKIEVNCANGCDGKDAQKIRMFWSKLVEKDIPAAHATFFQSKADKERLAKSAAERCMQYQSVFMCKEVTLDLQSNANTVSPSEPEELALEFQGSIEAENEDLRNSSASESSVTCLEEQGGTQAPVESCLSSADGTRKFLSQHLIHEEQVSLIDLPSGSSLANEGHATLLASVQAQREQNNFADDYAYDVHERSNTNVDTVQKSENDMLSRCNEGSVVEQIWSKDNPEKNEMEGSGKDPANWDLHSKPGSEVVSATAASGESEEVEQRVDLLSGGGLEHQLISLSEPSTLLSHPEPAEKGPLFCSNDALTSRDCEDAEDQVVYQEENYQKVNLSDRFQASVPTTEDFPRSENLHSKEFSQVFDMEQTQNESNQMMLHLFLDQKTHSSEFLSTRASSSLGLQGKNSFCDSSEAPSLTSEHVGDHMLKEHEPITELSLLVDDRSAKQKYQTEQAESVSSRTRAEFGQHDSMEPHWMTRHNKQDVQIYPFRQNSREVHHLAQSSQDAYSSLSFSPMLPVWSNPQQTMAGNMSHLSFKNHWNVEENADQTNWISAEAPTGPFFSSTRDEGGRPSSVSQYWDQLSRGPGVNSWSSKHEQGVSFLRGTTSNLQDEQIFQVHENWAGSVQGHSSSHLPYMWAMDRSGRVASHPWKNASMLSSSQYEQQKLQNACLSKMDPNFNASWH